MDDEHPVVKCTFSTTVAGPKSTEVRTSGAAPPMATTTWPNVARSAESTTAFTAELDRLNLETVPFPGSPVPRLADCRVAFACKRYEIHELGPARQALILGQVTHMYIAEEALGPVTRAGREERRAFPELADYSGKESPQANCSKVDSTAATTPSPCQCIADGAIKAVTQPRRDLGHHDVGRHQQQPVEYSSL